MSNALFKVLSTLAQESLDERQVIIACTRLRVLDVTSCGKVSGAEILCTVAGHCSELRELMVGALSGIGQRCLVIAAAPERLRMAERTEFTRARSRQLPPASSAVSPAISTLFKGWSTICNPAASGRCVPNLAKL